MLYCTLIVPAFVAFEALDFWEAPHSWVRSQRNTWSEHEILGILVKLMVVLVKYRSAQWLIPQIPGPDSSCRTYKGLNTCKWSCIKIDRYFWLSRRTNTLLFTDIHVHCQPSMGRMEMLQLVIPVLSRYFAYPRNKRLCEWWFSNCSREIFTSLCLMEIFFFGKQTDLTNILGTCNFSSGFSAVWMRHNIRCWWPV